MHWCWCHKINFLRNVKIPKITEISSGKNIDFDSMHSSSAVTVWWVSLTLCHFWMHNSNHCFYIQQQMYQVIFKTQVLQSDFIVKNMYIWHIFCIKHEISNSALLCVGFIPVMYISLLFFAFIGVLIKWQSLVCC